MSAPSFRTQLEGLINYHSKEGGSNTPDFILAQYLIASLEAYNEAATARAKWWEKRHAPAPARAEGESVGNTNAALPGQQHMTRDQMAEWMLAISCATSTAAMRTWSP